MSSTNNDNGQSATQPSTEEPSPSTSRGRGSRRGGNSQTILINPIGYEGECEKVGAILALKVEKFNKKVSFEQFMEKICNNIVKSILMAVICSICKKN